MGGRAGGWVGRRAGETSTEKARPPQRSRLRDQGRASSEILPNPGRAPGWVETQVRVRKVLQRPHHPRRKVTPVYQSRMGWEQVSIAQRSDLGSRASYSGGES